MLSSIRRTQIGMNYKQAMLSPLHIQLYGPASRTVERLRWERQDPSTGACDTDSACSDVVQAAGNNDKAALGEARSINRSP